MGCVTPFPLFEITSEQETSAKTALPISCSWLTGGNTSCCAVMYNILTPLSCHLHESASHYNKNRLQERKTVFSLCISREDEQLILTARAILSVLLNTNKLKLILPPLLYTCVLSMSSETQSGWYLDYLPLELSSA